MVGLEIQRVSPQFTLFFNLNMLRTLIRIQLTREEMLTALLKYGYN